ncbi:16S rRNA (cytosine(1402)-N(4))-methyltransferase [Oceanidesulfovibrio indonesiensis]|uniref:16S rRNA (Cytosine(1402)-N(4))-methyltransferase n=1 Tax=Oceanidesulfovibrio indonesiensis TaxID=54767 RepID=A0A7M3MIE5_9BACT|nr:class I SAM-dependent methyltransferase [Oceanidesulfovibrio indonesiensis]TVM19462.1 16S rRNA (cytosine(1402)-N(4))-methyltransferase [Oceanidesulfovibrio indonesiensis]
METYFDVLCLTREAVSRALRRASDDDSGALLAVDATVGNGRDTLLLAHHVGEGGRVYGFDVQRRGLDIAWQRLTKAGMEQRVTLLHAGHERMAELLPADAQGRVRAVMFNLGYLPGSDKNVVTRPETTRAALAAALSVLAPGGLVSIVAYPAHPGGAKELAAVREWCASLAAPPYKAMEYGMANIPDAKRLFLVTRLR